MWPVPLCPLADRCTIICYKNGCDLIFCRVVVAPHISIFGRSKSKLDVLNAFV